MDAIVTLVSLDHPWLPVYTGLPPCQSIRGCHSYSGIPGPSMVTSVYWSTPLVRVSVDARVTLVSQDHPVLLVYTGLPPCQSIRGCHSYCGTYPWTIHGYQYILVYPLVRVSVDYIVTLVSLDHQWLPVYTGLPPCQSIRGCHSYSGIPGPSMVTSVHWSTPLVRVSVDARVTLVSQDHPVLPVYTGLPPCQSIRGCHSYSGIPGPSMVTSIYWSTPLVRVSVDARVTLVSLDHPWLPVYTGLSPLSEYPWMP